MKIKNFKDFVNESSDDLEDKIHQEYLEDNIDEKEAVKQLLEIGLDKRDANHEVSRWKREKLGN